MTDEESDEMCGPWNHCYYCGGTGSIITSDREDSGEYCPCNWQTKDEVMTYEKWRTESEARIKSLFP